MWEVLKCVAVAWVFLLMPKLHSALQERRKTGTRWNCPTCLHWRLVYWWKKIINAFWHQTNKVWSCKARRYELWIKEASLQWQSCDGFHVQVVSAQYSSITVVVSLYFTWPSIFTKFKGCGFFWSCKQRFSWVLKPVSGSSNGVFGSFGFFFLYVR